MPCDQCSTVEICCDTNDGRAFCRRHCPDPHNDPGHLILPVIHLNGTGRERLLDNTLAVGRAVKAAMDALDDAWPHQRDYYPDPGRWEKARAQAERRADLLRDLYRELTAEAEALADLGT